MKNLLRIIIMGIIIICSPLVMTNNVMGGGANYTTPETLQSRVDYSLRIIWKLQAKYRTSQYNELMVRMNPRDRQIYKSVLIVFNKAKMDQSKQTILALQSKYRTRDHNMLMYRMRSLDKQIYIDALQVYNQADAAYKYLIQNR